MSEQDSTPAEGETPEAPETKPEPVAKTYDEGYVKELRAEAAAHRKAKQELQAKVEEFESANQSELEKLTGKLTKTEQRANEAEAALLRFQVAAEKQVPAEALDLLTGTSREELEAKADKLLSFVNRPEPDFDGGAREPVDEDLSPEEAHNRLFLEAMGLTPKT